MPSLTEIKINTDVLMLTPEQKQTGTQSSEEKMERCLTLCSICLSTPAYIEGFCTDRLQQILVGNLSKCRTAPADTVRLNLRLKQAHIQGVEGTRNLGGIRAKRWEKQSQAEKSALIVSGHHGYLALHRASLWMSTHRERRLILAVTSRHWGRL